MNNFTADNFTPEQETFLDKAAAEFERGWPVEALKSARIGRPLSVGTDSATIVPVRLDSTRLNAIDKAAVAAGTTRSQIIRNAIDKELQVA
jgi:hypothetical protein